MIVEQRHANFRHVLAARGLDALVLTNFWAESPQGGDYDIVYLSNLQRRYIFSILVLTLDDICVWVESDDLPRAREETWLKTTEALEPGEQWGYTGPEMARMAAARIRDMVKKADIRVGYDGRYLPGSIALSLRDLGLALKEVSFDLEQSKIVKDELELQMMRRASELADRGCIKVAESVREGIRERELAALAEAEMRAHGAECFWWKTLLASGPDADRWFDTPSDRTVKRGDVVLMDFTPVYQGYGGDIARAFVFGQPTKEQQEVWDLCKAALDAACAVLREGVSLRELMQAGARVVEGSPYEKCYIGTGHTIGLYSHVYPIFLASIERMKTIPSSVLDIRMKPGMVAAMEIIFTVPGVGGIRLEDAYIVGAEQPENMNRAPMLMYV